MAEMTQRQRLRVVAEMLFYLNTIKRIMLILFFTSGKENTRATNSLCCSR
ncbi:hypothetical protein SS322685_2256 [Shigella sonnei 3226-85]|nr:hypothetical protein EC182770_0104 [Escherichia coli 1827-70]EFS13317.1 hypothetical protein SF2457T_2540 [Shigella flexneri 2a str. 2457T]EGJ87452.1 hypothetical protein SF434370_1876 [Shigella flexneri 4343-70]EGW91862.1 hypothetical protein ECSTECDG1313_2537 [Escherichia coli STEC_DG131-3]EHV62669.1 hypothetical protein ECDEC6C_1859 [Escherichia coli DEC6C]EHW74637.1 hypothetical protein ECDEC10C_2627 [Escherichia coli DEC10C]EHX79724.1 hypothetical protein ECDEC14A_1737 [Escherichia co